MDKAAVMAAFNARGEFTRHSHTYDDTWGHAFRLYNEAHPHSHLNTRCGSCYKKVLDWLRA